MFFNPKRDQFQSNTLIETDFFQLLALKDIAKVPAVGPFEAENPRGAIMVAFFEHLKGITSIPVFFIWTPPSSGVKITWRRAQVHGLQYQFNTAMKSRLRLHWNFIITCIAPKTQRKTYWYHICSHSKTWIVEKLSAQCTKQSDVFFTCRGTNINVSPHQ